MAKTLNPSDLSGPRSYFTDLDPQDKSVNLDQIQRKLKIQLLTKKTITIAASSMFHRIGYDFFRSNDGLAQAIQEGVILPAIRDEYTGINNFFDAKEGPDFSLNSKAFFSEKTAFFVKWSLSENTTWFHQTLVKTIADSPAPLRLNAGLTEMECHTLIANLDNLLLSKPIGQRFLSRDDVMKAASFLNETNLAYIDDLTNFIYRLSGARVVNSEGHFPQSNLTSVKLVGNENLLADDRIFWDLYIEAVTSYMTKAARLSCERLDQLTFNDIMKIRQDLFDADFANTYDKLLELSKSEVVLLDPEKLLLRQEEISSIAANLEQALKTRLASEIKHKDDNSKKLMQLGNLVEKFGDTNLFGAISVCKAIPQITSLFSEKLADAMKQRTYVAQRSIASLTGWNPKQKRALLTGYTKLLHYGSP
jgi:hypothetical protein